MLIVTPIFVYIFNCISTPGIYVSDASANGFNTILGLIFVQVCAPYWLLLQLGIDIHENVVAFIYMLIVLVSLIRVDYLKWSNTSMSNLMFYISWPFYIFFNIHNVAFYGRIINWLLFFIFVAAFASVSNYSGVYKPAYENCGIWYCIFSHMVGCLLSLELFSSYRWFTKTKVEHPIDHKAISEAWAKNLFISMSVDSLKSNLIDNQIMLNNLEVEFKCYRETMTNYINKLDNKLLRINKDLDYIYDNEIIESVVKNSDSKTTEDVYITDSVCTKDSNKNEALVFIKKHENRLKELECFCPNSLLEVWSKKNNTDDRILIIIILSKRDMNSSQIAEIVNVDRSTIGRIVNRYKLLIDEIIKMGF